MVAHSAGFPSCILQMYLSIWKTEFFKTRLCLQAHWHFLKQIQIVDEFKVIFYEFQWQLSFSSIKYWVNLYELYCEIWSVMIGLIPLVPVIILVMTNVVGCSAQHFFSIISIRLCIIQWSGNHTWFTDREIEVRLFICKQGL